MYFVSRPTRDVQYYNSSERTLNPSARDPWNETRQGGELGSQLIERRQCMLLGCLAVAPPNLHAIQRHLSHRKTDLHCAIRKAVSIAIALYFSARVPISFVNQQASAKSCFPHLDRLGWRRRPHITNCVDDRKLRYGLTPHGRWSWSSGVRSLDRGAAADETSHSTQT